jgi:hypothetical protein
VEAELRSGAERPLLFLGLLPAAPIVTYNRMNRPKRHGKPVPRIDQADGDRELDQLGVVEVLADVLELLILDGPVGQSRELLRPGECGPFTPGEDRCLPPCGNQMHALLGLAILPGFTAVQIDTIGAAVDLRGPELHEMQQPLIQA